MKKINKNLIQKIIDFFQKIISFKKKIIMTFTLCGNKFLTIIYNELQKLINSKL